MKTVFSLLILIAFYGLAGCGPAGPRDNAGVEMSTAVRRSPWESGTGNGSQLLTPHYVIYTTAGNRILTTFLPGFMEAAYANYLRLANLPERQLEKPLPVYMMGSRSEWASLTTSVVGPQEASTYLSLTAGGYCYKGVCVFWDIGNLGTFSVASHEGLHQFFNHRLKERLPMWLEEGLCTVAEGYDISGSTVAFTPRRNSMRFTDLRAAVIQGRWIPLEKLLSMDSGEAIGGGNNTEAVGYYGQLWALAQFILSNDQYSEGLSALMADADGGNFAKALGMSRQQFGQLPPGSRAYNKAVSTPIFQRYISRDLQAFDRDYRQFAKKMARL